MGKPTLEELIEAARANKYGIGRIGRWGVNLIPVGPRTRLMRAHERLDYYLDGKRVSKERFMSEMEVK